MTRSTDSLVAFLRVRCRSGLVGITALSLAILVSAFGPIGCEAAQRQHPVDPSTIDTSTTRGLIEKLQAQNDTPEKSDNLRYVGFLIADYGASMTSQVVNRMLLNDDLTPDQRIWLQEIRIDMGRALIGCASNSDPASNIFQELFIYRIAYLIAKRDAPGVLKGKEAPLITTLHDLQELIWKKVSQGVEASLEPLNTDVNTWMKEYGNHTHRFWWPREIGLLMTLDSVNNLQFTGMLASVERANEGIDRLDKTLDTSQFLLERLPMLASWEFELAMAKLLANPIVQSFTHSVESLSGQMVKLQGTLGTTVGSLNVQLGKFREAITSDFGSMAQGINALSQMLADSRDQLSSAMNKLGSEFSSQGMDMAKQLEAAGTEIGKSSTSLSEVLKQLDQTVVSQEKKVEQMVDGIRSELSGQTDSIVDRVTLRIGMAVGLGVLCSLVIAGLLAIIAIRSGVLGRPPGVK
ncbi:MAG: hypothetical protein CBC35_05790 [Planctomycetes bacterium TMED75]|nr:hypothetical protein [Planctomycetaceae bacterium]OUU93326.1 MAG: hypothetical protein CBC35_05790 [Planctomycetes bacterium TMED75]